jgi:hypothetical protein
MDWQPIETAPKDGTQIILGCFVHHKGYGTDAMMAGHWFDGRFAVGMGFAFDDLIFHASVQMPWTHWCPLPEPPASP